MWARAKGGIEMQLKVGDIMRIIAEMKKSGMTDKEIKETPIYIGNDDELNGIHTAWYVDFIREDDDEYTNLVEMIKEDHHNVKFEGKCILIS